MRVGSELGRWEELKKVLEEFLEDHPGHVRALTKLAEIYLDDGETNKAETLVSRGLVLDRWHEDLLRLSFRLRHAGQPPLARLDTRLAEKPLDLA
jgi:thioredoxin-like negative regulator of GroEL